MEENTQNQPPVSTPSAVVVPQSESKKLSMPVAILLAGVIIALAIILAARGGGNGLFKSKNNSGKINVTEVGDTKTMEPVTDDDHIRGDLSKAKVAVVEFSDLQCPYCKQIHPVLTKMTEVYGSDVAWVYRHFPLESIHPRARISDHASECVNELAGNEGFWEFIDSIFAYTGNDDPLTDENLAKLAAASGVDSAAFAACQTSGKYDSKIDAYLSDANSAGAQGTPDVTVINLETGDAVHIGADPSLLAQVIDKMLNNK